MDDPHRDARADLTRWRQSVPDNFYRSDTQLRRVLDRWMEPDRRAASEDHFAHFGGVVAGALDEAAATNNEGDHLPRLDRWSPHGERQEGIVHHPSNGDCARAIYQDGRAIAVYADPPANLHALALFYLSSHAGEAGHNCPVACTAGLVKALSALGSDELKERYLPGLLSDRVPGRLHGAQFLTEVQGGSDVGSNAVRAVPDGRALGTERVRIHGEKWFCSNADADLQLLTARIEGGPQGTSGLGLFLVPRVLDDGALNGFALRRLKDKLGTRSMPSAEIDYDGAVGYALGPVDRGFRNVMTHVIHTSRLYNAVGCAGIARRSLLEAAAYAGRRRAFGARIADYPLVHEMIADLRAVSAALTAATLEAAWRQDRVETGAADEVEAGYQRVAVNLVKMRSAQHAHRAVLTAIETLGGNGAIESFSVLPRLLRDNVVYENWEGTHNTLIAQTLRDFARLRLHEPFLAFLRAGLETGDGEVDGALEPASRRIDEAEEAVDVALAVADPGAAALALRPAVERLADVVLAGALARDVAAVGDSGPGAVATLAHFSRRQLPPLPPFDPEYADQVSRVAAG